MRIEKLFLILFLALALSIASSGCSGGGGGGGGGSSSGGSSGGGGGGGGSSSTTKNFNVSGFFTTDQGVLIGSSHQTSVTSPYFNQSSSLSGRIESDNFITDDETIDRFLLKEKELYFERKDLPQYLIDYANEVQSSEGINGINPSKLKGSKDYNEGDQVIFNILENGSSWSTCTAQCYKKGTNCYVFIDTASADIVGGDRTTVATNAARNFDSNNTPFNTGSGIYGVTRNYFGSEWTPGIDSDARIFILISPKLGRTGLYGYYYSLDETTGSYSNQKEIIYINDNLWSGNMFNGVATIAHEFQHMICWNEKYRGGGGYETTTINEGQSMLSEHLNGFTVGGGAGYSGNGYMIRAVRSFLNSPDSFWFFSWGGSSLDYGAAYLFMEYIYERFGGAVITSIATSSSTSSSNIATYTGVTFDSLFRDWCMVNYYDTLGGTPSLPSGSGSTRYANINLGGTYTGYSAYDNSTTSNYTLPGIQFSSSISSYPASSSVSLRPWNCKYIKYTRSGSGGNITLNLTLTMDSSYSIYSNFIHEHPAGTYSSYQ